MFESISLLDDDVHYQKLQRKLKEYDDRYGYMAPEVNPHGFFKYVLLASLIEKKVINYETEKSRFCKDNDTWESLFRRSFNDAWEIIGKYASKNENNLFGGTGLK